MASIETVDFGEFGKMNQVNISAVVGEGATNDRSDVLLVQTLFRIVGANDVFSNHIFGFGTAELPALSGVCDRQTIRAIWGFQRHRRHRLWNVDGRVHPANYRNRVLKKGPQARQMMITLLNMNAMQIGEHSDLLPVIRQLAPSIIFNGGGNADGTNGGAAAKTP